MDPRVVRPRFRPSSFVFSHKVIRVTNLWASRATISRRLPSAPAKFYVSRSILLSRSTSNIFPSMSSDRIIWTSLSELFLDCLSDEKHRIPPIKPTGPCLSGGDIFLGNVILMTLYVTLFKERNVSDWIAVVGTWNLLNSSDRFVQSYSGFDAHTIM